MSGPRSYLPYMEEERRALLTFRTFLLAFAEEPTLANFGRYQTASLRLDAVRAVAESGEARNEANCQVPWAA
jgi:hypothetical protein